MLKKYNRFIIIFIFSLLFISLACAQTPPPATEVGIRPTNTPLPTFTPTATTEAIAVIPTPALTPLATDTPTPIPPTATLTATFAPSSTDTPLPEPTPTDTAALPTATFPPPTATSPPLPTETPTLTPIPEPIIKYVLAGTSRDFNCEYTRIYGSVQNANNIGLPNVEVRALGIHQTTGLDFSTRTDAEGRYEAFNIPLPDLQAGQWAVMVMEEGREVSERFHWASTAVCQSDDLGHSQVLKVDWKLVE